MKETKKVRVKVKKRKLKIKNILFSILTIIILINFIYCLLNIKIKNIYVINNNLISDKEILTDSKLYNYPSYLLSFKYKIKKELKNNNEYIKNVNISKKKLKIYLYVEEYKQIANYKNKVIIENGSLLANEKINSLPTIINNIDDVYNKFVENFNKIDNDILTKISQIEYAPSDKDKELFLLYMNDGNYAYVTLDKIERINKYSDIVSQMTGKGIIHLEEKMDSQNQYDVVYVEYK